MRPRPSGIGVTGLLAETVRPWSLNEFDSHYKCSKETKRCSRLVLERMLSLLQSIRRLRRGLTDIWKRGPDLVERHRILQVRANCFAQGAKRIAFGPSVERDQREDFATRNNTLVMHTTTATYAKVSAVHTIDAQQHSEDSWAGSWNGHWKWEGWHIVFYNLLCSH